MISMIRTRIYLILAGFNCATYIVDSFGEDDDMLDIYLPWLLNDVPDQYIDGLSHTSDTCLINL